MPYEVTTERHHKPRSGVSLGGLGCGWFELRQDGACYHWNIFNNPPVGRGAPFMLPHHSVLFFLVRYQVRGEEPRLRLLQIEESHNSAGIETHEFQYIFPWLAGVDRIDYSATFPFVRLRLGERDMPLEIELEAWSPFIPHDAKHSALPVAFFDLRLRSTADRPVDVSILGTLRNCVGYDAKHKAWSSRRLDAAGHRGVEMGCTDLDPAHASWGSMALVSLHPASRGWLGWGHVHPFYETLLRARELPDVDDTAARNVPDPATGRPWAMHPCWSTLGRTATLERRGEELAHGFVVAWDFPNRYGRPDDGPGFGVPGYLEANAAAGAGREAALLEGHYYRNFFVSAGEVATYAAARRDSLHEQTRRFHDAFYAATLPAPVLDQVNSQLNTFRTSSWFTLAGNFGIVEGLGPTVPFAGLATTDVAMYGGVATAALFPDLERAVVRAHVRFQNPDGSVCHSINHNFRCPEPGEASTRRLDMPAQFAYQALRAGFWPADRAFLAEVWPAAQRALDYGLRERDANGDGLPDMEGVMCSYDNFPMYGVAPYVATQWLAALSAAVAAAEILGDKVAFERYKTVLERGAAALEAAAWNGEYYRLWADGGRHDEGCLTDQILGHWACQLADLPAFLPTERVRSALRAILRSNYRPDQGLRNCQWPGDTFLHPVTDDCWVDQANTCWTGVELAFASLLLYEGMAAEAFEIIGNVDARHRRWGNYWDHQEFGGHYFRPMSAWAIIPAALGQRVRDGVITFDPRVPGTHRRLLWVTADGYGHYEQAPGGVALRVLAGSLRARRLRLRLPEAGAEGWSLDVPGTTPRRERDGGFLVLDFPAGLALNTGDVLRWGQPPFTGWEIDARPAVPASNTPP